MMIEKAKSIEDPARRQHMVQAIANFMKMAYVQWNKDFVADESILSDLRIMSHGELELNDNFNFNRVELRTNQNSSSNNPRNRNNNQNNNNNPRNRNNNQRNNNQQNRNRNKR
jgi:hypothetical protein